MKGAAGRPPLPHECACAGRRLPCAGAGAMAVVPDTGGGLWLVATAYHDRGWSTKSPLFKFDPKMKRCTAPSSSQQKCRHHSARAWNRACIGLDGPACNPFVLRSDSTAAVGQVRSGFQTSDAWPARCKSSLSLPFVALPWSANSRLSFRLRSLICSAGLSPIAPSRPQAETWEQNGRQWLFFSEDRSDTTTQLDSQLFVLDPVSRLNTAWQVACTHHGDVARIWTCS